VSYSYRYPHEPEVRLTESYPIVQRASIRFFRRVTSFWRGLFHQIGACSRIANPCVLPHTRAASKVLAIR